MIRVEMDERRVVIRGHAGYAKRGEDIVCAAVSALVYVQIRMLERRGALEALHSEAGHVAMTLRKDSGADLEVLQLGLKMLSREYPQHVQIVQR